MRDIASRQMQQVLDNLRADFPQLPASELEAAVSGGFEEFDGAPVRDYLPVLVGRRVRTRLHHHARPDRRRCSG